MQKEPKLTLVGAGPGDAELITLKGIKALQTADVVLYDALVNEELLDFVPEHCPKIYVGKRAGQHSLVQEDINKLIVKYALNCGHVVRLKGGDSFVFGRGFEEIDFAKSYNIEVQVIPGVSSAISVPALQHIPVTNRGLNESFWVITGTTTNGKVSEDVYQAVKTNATVVLLMGVGNLDVIVNAYKAEGKHRLPIAVIQNGSLPNEKIAIGVVDTIQERVEELQIGAPAIIIAGEVVGLHTEFQKIKESYLYVDNL